MSSDIFAKKENTTERKYSPSDIATTRPEPTDEQKLRQFDMPDKGIGYKKKVEAEIKSKKEAKEFEENNIKLDTGEYISKEEFNKLSKEEQDKLKTQGLTKYIEAAKEQGEIAEKEFEEKNIKLSTGEWISKEEFGKLDVSKQKLLLEKGIDAYNKEAEDFNKLHNEGVKKLEFYIGNQYQVIPKPTQLYDTKGKLINDFQLIHGADPNQYVVVWDGKGEISPDYVGEVGSNLKLIPRDQLQNYIELVNRLPDGWSIEGMGEETTTKYGFRQLVNIKNPNGESVTLPITNAVSQLAKDGVIKIPEKFVIPPLKDINEIVDKDSYEVFPPSYQGQIGTFVKFKVDGKEYQANALDVLHYANILKNVGEGKKYVKVSAPSATGGLVGASTVVLTDKDGVSKGYNLGSAWALVTTDGKFEQQEYIPEIPQYFAGGQYGGAAAGLPVSAGGTYGRVTGVSLPAYQEASIQTALISGVPNIVNAAQLLKDINEGKVKESNLTVEQYNLLNSLSITKDERGKYELTSMPFLPEVGTPRVTNALQIINNLNAGLVKETELTPEQVSIVSKEAIKLESGDYTLKEDYAQAKNMVLTNTGDMIAKPYFDTFNDNDKQTIINQGTDAVIVKLPDGIEIKKVDFDRLNNVWQETLRNEGKKGYDKLVKSQNEIINVLDSKYKQGDGYNLAKYLRDNHVDGINNLVIAGFLNKDIKDAVIFNQSPAAKETKIEIYQNKIIEKTGGKYNDVNTFVTNPITWVNFSKEYPKLADEFKLLMDDVNKSAGIRDNQGTVAPISLDLFTEQFALARGHEGVTQIDISSVFDKEKNNIRTLAALRYKELYGDTASNKAVIDNALQFAFAPARALKPEVKITDITPWEWTIGAAQLGAIGAGGLGSIISKASVPLAGTITEAVIQTGATAVFSIDTINNLKSMNPTQIALSSAFDLLMLAGTLGTITRAVKKPSIKNIDTASKLISKGSNEAKPELVNQGIKLLKEVGVKESEINKFVSAESLKSINTVGIVADEAITKFASMDVKTFNELADKGKIKPFGNQLSDVKSVKSGKKPFAMISEGLEYEEAIKYAGDKGLEVVESPTTIGTKQYAVYKKGNDYLLHAYYDILAKYNAGIKTPNELFYNVAYHIEIGKLLGYSDADIAMYIKNFRELPELQKNTTNPRIKELLKQLEEPEGALKLVSKVGDKLETDTAPIKIKLDSFKGRTSVDIDNKANISYTEITVRKGVEDVYVNGQKVTKSAPLNFGDYIRVGDKGIAFIPKEVTIEALAKQAAEFSAEAGRKVEEVKKSEFKGNIIKELTESGGTIIAKLGDDIAGRADVSIRGDGIMITNINVPKEFRTRGVARQLQLEVQKIADESNKPVYAGILSKAGESFLKALERENYIKLEEIPSGLAKIEGKDVTVSYKIIKGEVAEPTVVSRVSSEVANMNQQALKQIANITRNKDVIFAVNTINEGLANGNIALIQKGGRLLIDAGNKIPAELGGDVIIRKGELIKSNPEQLIKMVKSGEIPSELKLNEITENNIKFSEEIINKISERPSTPTEKILNNEINKELKEVDFDAELDSIINKVNESENNIEIRDNTIESLNEAKGKLSSEFELDALLGKVKNKASELDIDLILSEAIYKVTPDTGDVVRVDNKIGHIAEVIVDRKTGQPVYLIEYWDITQKPQYIPYKGINKIPIEDAQSLIKQFKKEDVIKEAYKLRKEPPEELPPETPKGKDRPPQPKPPEIPPFKKGRLEILSKGEESREVREVGYERMKDYPGYYEYGSTDVISPVKQLDTTINPWDLTSQRISVMTMEKPRMLVEAPVKEPEVKPQVKPKKAPVKTEPKPEPKPEPKVEPKEPSVEPESPMHEPIKTRPFEPIPEKSPMHEPIPEPKPYEKVETTKIVAPKVGTTIITTTRVIPTPDVLKKGKSKDGTRRKVETISTPITVTEPIIINEPSTDSFWAPSEKVSTKPYTIGGTQTLPNIVTSPYPQPEPMAESAPQPTSKPQPKPESQPVPEPVSAIIPSPIPVPEPQPVPEPIPQPVPTPPPPPPPPPPPTETKGEIKFNALTKEQRESTIGWKQGFMYIYRYKPWGKKDVIHSLKPIEGIPQFTGAKSAYESLIARGEELPQGIWDLGIFDIKIKKGVEGKPELVYIPDEEQIGREQISKSTEETDSESVEDVLEEPTVEEEPMMEEEPTIKSNLTPEEEAEIDQILDIDNEPIKKENVQELNIKSPQKKIVKKQALKEKRFNFLTGDYEEVNENISGFGLW